MLLELFPFLQRTIPAGKFERSVFSLVARYATDKRALREELDAAEQLRGIPVEHNALRQKKAAELYLLLERNIAQEQIRNRIPPEILREKILNQCHPQRAEGNFALMFLPHYERQMKFFERFADMIFARAAELLTPQKYAEFMRAFAVEPLLKGAVKNGGIAWRRVERQVSDFTPPVRRDTIQDLLKRGMAALTGVMLAALGELRTELVFSETYEHFHEPIDFIDDASKVLLIVPENFLTDERIGLMDKEELEKELRLKNKALETTLAEVQGEKVKLSALTREELESKVRQRTAELVNALTEVQTAQTKLQDAKAKDDAFLENISDGLIAIDPQGKIILWNRAAGNILGLARNDAIGKPFQDHIVFVKEEEGTPDASFIEKMLKGGSAAVTHREMGLMRKDKSVVAVAVSASPILDEQNRLTSAIVTFRDITSERELQKTREEFSSLATHELRTPVAAIKGYVKLLITESAGKIAEKQKQYLEQIDRANERLLTLVNAMLDISRIELGTLAIEPKPTYLPDLADAVLADLAPRIKEKKQKLAKEYDRTVPIMDLDPSLTHAIIENLFANAVKYTPDGGSITIAIQKRVNNALITVKDTGYGIPKAQQPRIFEKLFRADNARTKVMEGTGLGLYLVKSILDQTGGRIWFDSEENKGSTFYATIPLAGMRRRQGLKGLS